MTIYYGSLSNNQFTSELLIALLSVLKVKRPSIYNSLIKGNISADEFYRQSALDIMQVRSSDGFNPEWAKDMLDCCIMSDSEFESATKSEDGAKAVRPGLKQMESMMRNRKKSIPFLCSQLDRFSLQPQ
jgi:hypothetical protein